MLQYCSRRDLHEMVELSSICLIALAFIVNAISDASSGPIIGVVVVRLVALVRSVVCGLSVLMFDNPSDTYFSFTVRQP